MAKYPKANIGDPLDMLAEECAEVIKERIKALRFGIEGDEYVREHGNPSPRERILQEIGDLLFVVDALVARGTFSKDEIAFAKQRKRARMEELFGIKKVMEWLKPLVGPAVGEMP